MLLWTELCLQNSYAEALTPNVMASEMELLGGDYVQVSLEGRGPSLPLSLLHMRTQQEGSCLKARKRVLARTQQCWHPDFRYLASRLEINACCRCHPVCSILVSQPE